ncbi:MAG: hypothetical protein JW791_00145 [Nanoarchaeota archaeon]|nr:hypothetical protein [Nanoarchaeota archaeon]
MGHALFKEKKLNKCRLEINSLSIIQFFSGKITLYDFYADKKSTDEIFKETRKAKAGDLFKFYLPDEYNKYKSNAFIENNIDSNGKGLKSLYFRE